MREFTDLGLSDAIVHAFASLGFETPTEIQELAIPAILDRRDAYVSSATGTGKTFAYLAPILSSIEQTTGTIQAVIAAPTHDLAAQIERETLRLAHAAGLEARVTMALGSIPLKRQLERLSEKPHIVVGSAGRIRDLALGGHIDLSACLWAVLDEADRLFENEARDITAEMLSALPATCSRLLVSASLPNRTVERSAAWFRDPVHLVIDPSEALRTSIEHWCFHSASRSKLDFLRRFEAAVKPERCLLFASTNAAIFTIQKRLDYLGFPAVVLKSDKDGNDRRDAVEAFSNGTARWLITTDLGARGLDIADVSHVVSFDLPEEPTVYMHRAGRTGRAGKHGVSIAVADLVELKRASKIAVRYGFPFVCKLLDSGVVHDIEPENFFALAEEEEAARRDVKLEGSKRPDPRAPGRRGVYGVKSRRAPNDGKTRQRQDQPSNHQSRSSQKNEASHPKKGLSKRPKHPSPAADAPPPTAESQSAPAQQKRRHRRRRNGPKEDRKPGAES